MKPFIILVLTILTMFLSGCKQNDIPEPVEETPAVWIECEINGMPFKMEAGENAVYATAIANDFDVNKREYIFKMDALALKKSFQISIYNYQHKLGDMYEDLDSTIKPGEGRFLYTSMWPNFKPLPSRMFVIYEDLEKSLKYFTIPIYQGSSSYFEIVSVKDVVNEGKKFKMAEIRFSFELECPDNHWKLWVTKGHGFIPFGQK
ncbi:MAG TPA: hypothetical protein VEC12_07710 [Bacteroidia bacterium]|nr:hypothetical protein [Bacteroidia bacterium]